MLPYKAAAHLGSRQLTKVWNRAIITYYYTAKDSPNWKQDVCDSISLSNSWYYQWLYGCVNICLSLFSVSLSGMSVEALAMLMAAVIQGQVLWVYNKDRDQACLNVDQVPDLPHSTALHETVTITPTHQNHTIKYCVGQMFRCYSGVFPFIISGVC